MTGDSGATAVASRRLHSQPRLLAYQYSQDTVSLHILRVERAWGMSQHTLPPPPSESKSAPAEGCPCPTAPKPSCLAPTLLEIVIHESETNVHPERKTTPGHARSVQISAAQQKATVARGIDDGCDDCAFGTHLLTTITSVHIYILQIRIRELVLLSNDMEMQPFPACATSFWFILGAGVGGGGMRGMRKEGVLCKGAGAEGGQGTPTADMKVSTSSYK